MWRLASLALVGSLAACGPAPLGQTQANPTALGLAERNALRLEGLDPADPANVLAVRCLLRAASPAQRAGVEQATTRAELDAVIGPIFEDEAVGTCIIAAVNAANPV